MNKFVAAAAVGLAALALQCPPATAAQSTSQAAVPPVDEGTHRDASEVGAATATPVPPLSSQGGASGGVEPPGVHLAGYATPGRVTAAGRVAASGLAVVMLLAVTAGLITRRRGWNGRRRSRRCSMSDEELRDLLGIFPRPRPAT
jgi:hypothetical protein